MKKKYKYGIFVASAILACSSLALSNNNVMETNHVVQAATNDGSSAEKAYELSYKTDKNLENRTIQFTKGLTADDVEDFYNEHMHVYVGKNEAKEREDEYEYLSPDEIKEKNQAYGYDITEGTRENRVSYTDKDGRSVDYNRNLDSSLKKKDEDKATSMLLEPGDHITITTDANSPTLLANKWYKWKLKDNEFAKGNPVDNAEKEMDGKELPADIKKRIDDKTHDGYIREVTDADGNLPMISGKKDSDGYYPDIFLGTNQFTEPITFIISDKEGHHITPNPNILGRERNVIDGAPVVPKDENKNTDPVPVITDDKNNKGKGDDQVVIREDPTSKQLSWYDASTDDDGTAFDYTPVKTKDKLEAGQVDLPNKDNSVFDKIDGEDLIETNDLIYVHNAYIYDEKGNVLKKDASFRIIPKYTKVRLFNNGGAVYKNARDGKKYCRIDNHEYVKLANIGKVSKPQTVHRKGKIDAKSKYGVKLYDSNGKLLRNHKGKIRVLRKAVNVKFDKKKFMNKQTYYRIKDTKIWVRSSNIKFVKKN